MSITLHGSPISNYYNKAKLALLEKGVAFAEARAGTPGGTTNEAGVLESSPLGKIPYLTTPDGPLCESQVILDYVEACWPEPPLLPVQPFAAAKVRELTTFIDWHLEIVARRLYGAAFFKGAELPDAEREEIRKQLTANIAAFKRLAKFSPYVAGDVFTQADCSAFTSLPVIGMATKAVYGEDLLLAAGIDYKDYVKRVSERPSAQKVIADRKAAQARMST
ncbi:MAG: glutathione S-transferase [Pseudomonadota bacterium]|nr:glutathione S-transferase [Pseudomonadota bacterium]